MSSTLSIKIRFSRTKGSKGLNTGLRIQTPDGAVADIDNFLKPMEMNLKIHEKHGVEVPVIVTDVLGEQNEIDLQVTMDDINPDLHPLLRENTIRDFYDKDGNLVLLRDTAKDNEDMIEELLVPVDELAVEAEEGDDWDESEYVESTPDFTLGGMFDMVEDFVDGDTL